MTEQPAPNRAARRAGRKIAVASPDPSLFPSAIVVTHIPHPENAVNGQVPVAIQLQTFGPLGPRRRVVGQLLVDLGQQLLQTAPAPAPAPVLWTPDGPKVG